MFENILDPDLLEIITSAFLAIVAWATAKYLVPLIKTERHRRYAQWIANIADDATDDLVASHPSDWAKYLDSAVDKIVEVCGLQDASVAKRAVNAAIVRKRLPADSPQ
jgi:hypothetical protein